MSEAPTIIQFKGKRLEEMSRDELVDAVRCLGRMLDEHMTPQAREARALGEVERMRRGRWRPAPKPLPASFRPDWGIE